MSNQPPNQPQGSSQQTQGQQPPQQPPQQPQQQQQPPQQPPRQPPQGPPRGGGSRPARGGGTDTIANAAKVAAAIAVVGIVIGLIPITFGIVADYQVLYGTEDTIDDFENRYEDVPDDQREQQQEEEAAQKRQSIVRSIAGGSNTEYPGYFGLGVGPISGILLSGIAGAIVATQLSGGTREVLIIASVGALVGAFLFVFLATFLATLGWESTAEGDTQIKAAVQFVPLLINSLAIGILGAIASGGSAFFIDQLGD